MVPDGGFSVTLGNGTKGGYGRKNNYAGEALPQCSERIHLHTRHERQAGERAGQQGSHPAPGAAPASATSFLHAQ